MNSGLYIGHLRQDKLKQLGKVKNSVHLIFNESHNHNEESSKFAQTKFCTQAN